jgi:hypothetical protein
MLKEIKVIREDNKVEQGVFQEANGTYLWVTYTKSGNCKKLPTAMKKAGFTV